MRCIAARTERRAVRQTDTHTYKVVVMNGLYPYFNGLGSWDDMVTESRAGLRNSRDKWYFFFLRQNIRTTSVVHSVLLNCKDGFLPPGGMGSARMQLKPPSCSMHWDVQPLPNMPSWNDTPTGTNFPFLSFTLIPIHINLAHYTSLENQTSLHKIHIKFHENWSTVSK